MCANESLDPEVDWLLMWSATVWAVDPTDGFWWWNIDTLMSLFNGSIMRFCR